MEEIQVNLTREEILEIMVCIRVMHKLNDEIMIGHSILNKLQIAVKHSFLEEIK